MTLALSTPNALLAGITVLSVGLLLLAAAALAADIRLHRAMQQEARRRLEPLTRALGEGEDRLDLDALNSRIETLRTYFNSGLREEAMERLKVVETFLAGDRATMARLALARDSVMALSVDELAFVSADRESDIASVARLVAAYEALAHDADRARARARFDP
jgi:hypothetical protein